MEKELIKISKCFSEKVLLIQVQFSDIYDVINENDRITLCDSITSFNSKKMYCDSTSVAKTKTIKFKKLRKYYKKKNIKFIMCNINGIKKYLKSFISNSVYINCDMLYLYGNINEIDPEEIVKKYKRYTNDIKLEIKKENFIIYIDNKKTKTNKIKDTGYYIFDTCSNIRNTIADVMVG